MPSSTPSRTRKSSSWRLQVVDFSLVEAAKRVIDGALGVVPGETVLIVHDRSRSDLGNALLDAVSERNALGSVVLLEDVADRPHVALHPTIQSGLASCQASVFIAGFEPGESEMRRDLLSWVQRMRLRHAHMVGVTKRTMLQGMTTDPRRIAQVAAMVRARTRSTSVFSVRGPDGASLQVRCDPAHVWLEHSGVIRPGRWENLPTGEIVTAPGDVHGIFVCNASVSDAFGARAGLLRDAPLILEIDHGVVRSVRGGNDSLAREVAGWMRGARNLDRVGLFSLGTNVGITEAIGEVLCDQVMPGLHLALGSTLAEQTRASWDARAQLVLTSSGMDVDLDGIPLIRSGRYLNLT